MPAPAIALAETDADIARCFPIMSQLRPHLVEADFVTRIRRLQREGYSLAFLTDDSSTVRAVAGYRFYEKLFSGHNLYVDDLVTDTSARSRGHGRALLAWLVDQARARNCDNFELDSGVQRHEAHRFYLRERMKIASYHFTLPLKP